MAGKTYTSIAKGQPKPGKTDGFSTQSVVGGGPGGGSKGKKGKLPKTRKNRGFPDSKG